MSSLTFHFSKYPKMWAKFEAPNTTFEKNNCKVFISSHNTYFQLFSKTLLFQVYKCTMILKQVLVSILLY